MEAIAAASEQPLSDQNHQPPTKFIRIAERRVERALTYIRLVGDLSKGSDYELHDDDIVAITQTLQQALDDAMARLQASREEFRLRR